MPSPTSSTRPVSRASSLARYCSISVCKTETISSALNLMTTSLDQLFAKGVEAGANRAVVDPVAGSHDEAADQLRIDAGVQHRLQVQGVMNLLLQPPPVVVG